MAEDQQFKQLQAAYKQAGHHLGRNAQGGYFAANWGYIKPLATLAEVRHFLQVISPQRGKA